MRTKPVIDKERVGERKEVIKFAIWPRKARWVGTAQYSWVWLERYKVIYEFGNGFFRDKWFFVENQVL